MRVPQDPPIVGPGVNLIVGISGGSVRVRYGQELVELTFIGDGHRGVTLSLSRFEVEALAESLNAWLRRPQVEDDGP